MCRFDSRSRAAPIGWPSASIIIDRRARDNVTRQPSKWCETRWRAQPPRFSASVREDYIIENEESRGDGAVDGERGRHRGRHRGRAHEVSAFEREKSSTGGEWSCTSVASVEKRSRERNDRRGDGRVVSIRGRGKPARQSR